MRPVENERKYRIGVVINAVLKPSRDVMCGGIHCVQSECLGKPLLCQASGGTLPENIKRTTWTA